MNTTNLFVELVVVGIFAAVWFVLLLLACFGTPPWPTSDLLNIFTAVPVLAVVYVLGIITDRFADLIFGKLFPNIDEDSDTLREQRLHILGGSDKIAELGEYARSRARICRGVAFNSSLTLVVFLVWGSVSSVGLSVGPRSAVAAIIGAFIISSWFAWRQITNAGLNLSELQARISSKRSR